MREGSKTKKIDFMNDQITKKRLQFLKNAYLWSSTIFFLLLIGCTTGQGIAKKQEEMKSKLRNFYGISGAAFSPDGRKLAVGTGIMIYVLDVSSGKILSNLQLGWNGRFGRTRSVIFVDNDYVVTAGQGVIRLWDTGSGLVAHKLDLKLRQQLPRAIAWSDANQTLALTISDSSSTVQLVKLDKQGFGSLTDVEGIAVYPRDLLFSHDGHYLAAAGDGEGVYIHDLHNGQSAGYLPTRGSVKDLALFGNDQLLVAGEDVALWTFQGEGQDLAINNPSLKGQIAKQVTTKVAGTVAFGLLGVIGAYGGSIDGFVGAYEVANLPVSNRQQPWCGRSTTVSPDGRLLADVYPGITKEVIQIYELEKPGRSRKLHPPGEFTCIAKFSPDGKLLLITTNKVVRLYETDSWKHRDLEIH